MSEKAAVKATKQRQQFFRRGGFLFRKKYPAEHNNGQKLSGVKLARGRGIRQTALRMLSLELDETMMWIHLGSTT